MSARPAPLARSCTRLRSDDLRRFFSRQNRSALRTQGNSLLTIRVLSVNEPGARAAVITAKAIGNAVVRNRARRRIREAFRRCRESVRSEVHLVIIAKPAAAEARFDCLLSSLAQLLQQLELLTKPIAANNQS